MNQLEPCPQCHRHVLVTETACPFCAHALADAFANISPRVFPKARLGRAAMFAFGALAIGGCEGGKSPPDGGAMSDAARDAGSPADAIDDDGGVAIYSAAPTVPPKDADTGNTTKG